MPEALNRQPRLLFCIACMLAFTMRAASPGALEDLRAAKLIELAVMARVGDRFDNPSTADRADIEKLTAIFQELATKYPESSDVRNALASHLWSIGRQLAAVEQWESAEKIDPKNAETAYRLGDCHLTRGTVKKALEYLSRASELAPGNALYHQSLGTALYLFRKEVPGKPEAVMARALEELRKAAELEPFNAEYARSYAETFYGMPDPDWQEALHAWERYLSISTNKNFAFSNLARVSLKLGRKKEAREFLEKIEGRDFDRIKGVLIRQAEGD